MAVCGNYFITAYIQKQTIYKLKEKEKIKRKKNLDLKIIKSLYYCILFLQSFYYFLSCQTLLKQFC